jgi:hypothetical protein
MRKAHVARQGRVAGGLPLAAWQRRAACTETDQGGRFSRPFLIFARCISSRIHRRYSSRGVSSCLK